MIVKMKISARNQIKGSIVEIQLGITTAKVKVDIGGGNFITSIISTDALNEMELKVGSEVVTITKSTSVMLCVE